MKDPVSMVGEAPLTAVQPGAPQVQTVTARQEN
jgi:hypothetical protein